MSDRAAETALWDRRYADEGFFHGTEPNAFLAEHAARLAGPVLSLAEGEGRNAVFLAARGLDVLAVDFSRVGLAKAERLAVERGVRIRTQLADLADFEPEPGCYGGVISICAHLPSRVRRQLNPRIERALRPGGVLLLESYSQQQCGRGGPPDPDTLPSAAMLRAEWPGLEIELLREIERPACERPGHASMGAMVQLIARKPA